MAALTQDINTVCDDCAGIPASRPWRRWRIGIGANAVVFTMLGALAESIPKVLSQTRPPAPAFPPSNWPFQLLLVWNNQKKMGK